MAFVPVREVEEFQNFAEAMEEFIVEAWSDGLPTVPPTPQLVDAMIAGGDLGANELIGTAPVRDLPLYTWQAATSAVMAGCKPEYFPVVLATWEAMFEPHFNIHTMLTSTSGPAIAGIVSGPYAQAIGMNSGTNLLGPGNRANATIGRAIRIGAMTALKAIPSSMDYSSFGHPGKYTYHFAEGTPPEGWPTARELMGFSPLDTTVTVMAADAPHQIAHRWSPTAEEFLLTLAASMRDPSRNCTGSDSAFVLALGPEHRGLLVDAGMTPQSIAAALAQLSQVSVADLKAGGIDYERSRKFHGAPDARGLIRTARSEHVLVLAAGGLGSGFSMLIANFAGVGVSRPATRAVRVPNSPPAQHDPSRVRIQFV